MISHVISAWSATWSVHEQARDQWMSSQVNSVWWATWAVHDQSRDTCVISHVISAWWATWSVEDQLRDQCMISHVTSTAIHGVTKSRTRLSDWTELNWVPWPWIEPRPSVVKVWSPNHWTARKFPITSNLDPEKEMATHSSILAWKIPWTEEPGRLLQSMGLQRIRHDQETSLSFFVFQSR